MRTASPAFDLATLLLSTAAILSLANGVNAAMPSPGRPDFGPNVIILDPSMPIGEINSTLQRVEKHSNAWDENRTAVYFMPGTYGVPSTRAKQAAATSFVNSVVGAMTSIQGLGTTPGDVTINGNLRILGNLGTFWRSLQNCRINPVDPESPNALRWIVSEASPLRRLDVTGDLDLGVGHVAFGATIGNTRVSGEVRTGNAREPGAGGQAHYYTQESEVGSWSGQSINFVFSGVKGAPPTDFMPGDKTTLETTPVSRDAPFLFVRRSQFSVFVPKARFNARGTAWGMTARDGEVQPISRYFIAKPDSGAAAINAALQSGKNILLTPGVYKLTQAIHVTRPNTVILGMGYATLMPTNGTAAILTDDVPGVVLSSMIVDAGIKNSDVLIQLGPKGASHGVAANPGTLIDVYVRVGGAVAGKATTSVEINQHHALLNHTWLWRADLGPSGLAYDINPGDVGLVVNGDRVTVTGAYVEHYRKQQVIWNGDFGRTIFFQSEPPPDAMTQADRMKGKERGYAYYEVASNVTMHEGIGFAMYGAQSRSKEPITQTSEIIAPEVPGVHFRSITSVWLFGWGHYDNTFNHDGRPIGKDLVPSFIPGIAAIRQIAAWPDRK
jgi:hypothetical protein